MKKKMNNKKCPPEPTRHIKTLIIILLLAAVIIFAQQYNHNNPIIPSDNIYEIQITGQVTDYLNDKYENSEVEFLACLTGTINNGIIKVDNLFIPEQEATFNNVKPSYCYREDTVAIIHSHIIHDCEFSKEDIYSFGKTNQPALGVICRVGEIEFINSDIENIKVRINQ